MGEQRQNLRVQEQSVYQHQLYLLLRTLLASKLDQGPLTLILEDAHWSDASSIAVLSHLVTNIQDAPILLLLVYRSSWSVPWQEKIETINLKQFDLATRRQYLESLLGSSHLPPDLLTLSERAGGNPLFLSEMLVSLIEKGLLVAKTGQEREALAPPSGHADWQLRGNLEPAELPDTVQRTIEMRLDQLEREPRIVLETASVIGTSFTADMLLSALPDAGNGLF